MSPSNPKGADTEHRNVQIPQSLNFSLNSGGIINQGFTNFSVHERSGSAIDVPSSAVDSDRIMDHQHENTAEKSSSHSSSFDPDRADIQFPKAPEFLLHSGMIAGNTFYMEPGGAFLTEPTKKSRNEARTQFLASKKHSCDIEPQEVRFPQAPEFEPALWMPTRCGGPVDEDLRKKNVEKYPNRLNKRSNPIESSSAANLDDVKKLESQNQMLESSFCGLEMICYRSSAEGCVKKEICAIDLDKFSSPKLARQAREEKERDGIQVISNNEELFKEIKRVYEKQMCSFWRRWFSLMKLKSFVILKVTENSRPEPVHFGDDFERDMLWLYYNSSKAPKDLRYIKWVFGLRHTDHRYALQIVEGWSPLRIAVAGSLPAVISTIVGVAWSARAGDVVTGFTVALFILTAGTLLIAVLGVISSVATPR